MQTKVTYQEQVTHVITPGHINLQISYEVAGLVRAAIGPIGLERAIQNKYPQLSLEFFKLYEALDDLVEKNKIPNFDLINFDGTIVEN